MLNSTKLRLTALGVCLAGILVASGNVYAWSNDDSELTDTIRKILDDAAAPYKAAGFKIKDIWSHNQEIVIRGKKGIYEFGCYIMYDGKGNRVRLKCSHVTGYDATLQYKIRIDGKLTYKLVFVPVD